MEKKKYDFVGGFYNGFAPVELSKKWGFINEKGEEITPIKYDYVGVIYKGFAYVKISDKWGFINEKGEEIIPCKYDGVWDFHDGFASVQLSDKYGVVNAEGKEVIPCEYTSDEITPILESLVKNGEPKKKYDFVGSFVNGLACVKLSDKWGFINEKGEEITPIKYDLVGDFCVGFARVFLSNKWGVINENGEEITPIKYDWVWGFYNGFARVKLSYKYGVINTEGKEVIPCEYTSDEIEPLIENLRKNGEPKKKYDLEDLKCVVSDELLKRGFSAKITKFNVEDDKITVETDEFQTTPVLYKSIKIKGYGDVEKCENPHGDSFYKIAISFCARMSYFGGGSNGVDLFTIQVSTNTNFVHFSKPITF